MDLLTLSKISGEIKQFILEVASHPMFASGIDITYQDIFIVYVILMTSVYLMNCLPFAILGESFKNHISFVAYFISSLMLFFAFILNYLVLSLEPLNLEQQTSLLNFASVVSLSLLLVLIVLNTLMKAVLINKVSLFHLISMGFSAFVFTISNLFDIFQGYDVLILIFLESALSLAILYYMFNLRNYSGMNANIVIYSENNIYTGLDGKNFVLKKGKSKPTTESRSSSTESTSEVISTTSTTTSSSSILTNSVENQEASKAVSEKIVFTTPIVAKSLTLSANDINQESSGFEENSAVNSLDFSSTRSVMSEQNQSEIFDTTTSTEINNASSFNACESTLSEESTAGSAIKSNESSIFDESTVVSSFKQQRELLSSDDSNFVSTSHQIESTVSVASDIISESTYSSTDSEILAKLSMEVSSDFSTEQSIVQSGSSESNLENNNYSSSRCEDDSVYQEICTQLAKNTVNPILIAKKSSELKK